MAEVNMIADITAAVRAGRGLMAGTFTEKLYKLSGVFITFTVPVI